jgi:hypothetical protein
MRVRISAAPGHASSSPELNLTFLIARLNWEIGKTARLPLDYRAGGCIDRKKEKPTTRVGGVGFLHAIVFNSVQILNTGGR